MTAAAVGGGGGPGLHPAGPRVDHGRVGTERERLAARGRVPGADFLTLVERHRLGRLKVYLGYVAGVGKTFQMLREAQALRQRGIDVVVGFVETHGREETARQGDGLEVVPRLPIEYRGVRVEEMDLTAILRRKPAVVLVDEVAHSNAPGCPHRRRFQDVVALLEAGINVICAFNVQHLESLNDVVERATGVRVRETVPDTFLDHADQIVTLDLAVEDLLDRLRQGKVYPRAVVPQALANFFQPEALSSLREIVLREVAERLEHRAPRAARPEVPARPRGGERVMVCSSSSSPRARLLLRRGSRLAGRLNTHWFLVYVQTPGEAPHLIEAEAQRRLGETMDMARDLGAEVVRLAADDPVTALLDFARSHGVGHIVVGRSLQPWWRVLLRLSPLHRLIDEAEGFDVHVVSFEEEGEAP